MSIYNFYVYAYLREDGTPYYIGKGTKNRAWNKHKNINLPANKSRIIIIKKNLSEKDSLELEKELIQKYGRKNNNTGILINKTEGGEGGDTLSNHPRKNEIIEKIRQSNKQNVKHKKFGKNNPNWGNRYKHTDETKRIISENIKGRKLSELHKFRLSEKKKKQTIIQGLVFSSRTEASKYFGVSISTISLWVKGDKNVG